MPGISSYARTGPDSHALTAALPHLWRRARIPSRIVRKTARCGGPCESRSVQPMDPCPPLGVRRSSNEHGDRAAAEPGFLAEGASRTPGSAWAPGTGITGVWIAVGEVPRPTCGPPLSVQRPALEIRMNGSYYV
jgi:hypothetical protein